MKINRYRFRKTLTVFSFIFVLANAHAAVSVSLTNPGFEDPALNDNGFTSGGNVPGWTRSANSGSLIAGIWDPGATKFSQPIPEGENIAYMAYTSSLAQITSLTLEAGVTYTLSVDVGSRNDGFGGAEMSVGLFASGSLLAGNTTPVVANSGLFENRSVVFTPSAAHPLLGQAVEIQLASLTGSGKQISFDNVSLTFESRGGAAVPEVPGFGVVSGLILVSFTAFRRIKGKRAA